MTFSQKILSCLHTLNEAKIQQFAGILLIKGNYILLLKRSPTCDYPHTWSIPAGRVENGESSWEAAKRETREEAGISVNTDYVAEYEDREEAEKAFTTYVVPVKEQIKPILNWENTNWKWVPLSIIPSWNEQGISQIHPGLIRTLIHLGLI